jgi:hypothetical protein
MASLGARQGIFSPSMITTAEGLLFMASGMEAMIKWNGLKSTFVTVGVIAPTGTPVISSSGAGSLTGTYYIYVRFVDEDGNLSNLSPISTVHTASGAGQFNFSSIPVSSESKVTKRQILRNTDGQTTTFYVDVEINDNSTTTATSTKNDSTLAAQTEVPLLLPDGAANANIYGVPPNYKSVIVHHLGRIFACVEPEYTEGCVQVTNGSTTVTGIGTAFTSALANRYLYVAGATKNYQISSVDTTNQTLTLTSSYTDSTNKFAIYGIRPAPAERRLVYWSGANLPEAWQATDAAQIREDGDEFTGMTTITQYLYIFERRHIYRLSCCNDPVADAGVFLVEYRGCVNNRCCQVVEQVAYMLDEQGIHAFDGNRSEPLSGQIQGLFEDGMEGDYRINWQAKRYFHCSHYPAQETIRWFVSMGGDYLPQHAIAYSYRDNRFWIEEFPYPVGSASSGLLQDRYQVYLSSSGNRVFAMWIGSLDVADGSAGTVYGTATGSGLFSLTDSQAKFASSGLVGAPLWIVDGNGKGQRRTIVAVSGTTLTIKEPWLDLPNTTSIYQIGGIYWRYKTGAYRFIRKDVNNPRRLEVITKPLDNSALMNMRIYLNRSESPVTWNADYQLDDGQRVSSVKDSSDVECDLTKASGFFQMRIDGHRDHYLDAARYLELELNGVTNKDAQEVRSITIDGVLP